MRPPPGVAAICYNESVDSTQAMDQFDSARVAIRLASPYRSILDRLLIEKLWNHLEYATRHRILSAAERRLDLYFDGEKYLSVTVPETVFNPYKSSAPAKIMELILSERVRVKGKRVIDLGCGSGVIGLTAIHKQAASVCFSDVNPHVSALKDNPSLRGQDDFVIQDALAQTASKAEGEFDLVIAILPLAIVERKVAAASFEIGVKRPPDLLARCLEQSHRALAKGGRVLFYATFPGVLAYQAFLDQLHRDFAAESYRILAHQQLPSMGGDHLLFEATRRD